MAFSPPLLYRSSPCEHAPTLPDTLPLCLQVLLLHHMLQVPPWRHYPLTLQYLCADGAALHLGETRGGTRRQAPPPGLQPAHMTGSTQQHAATGCCSPGCEHPEGPRYLLHSP
jgi:hypothetical protein